MAHETPSDLAGKLRQMIAVLEAERQALASLEPEAISDCARDKESLCDVLRPSVGYTLDPETRELALTASRLNEVNRRVRNLLAANVAARIEALGDPNQVRCTYGRAIG
ncbi:hypothetical protein EH32_01350 [Erythrobacter litoralis]|uniref:Flagellar protein FlgN n=2 Tax=Erythrobacter litoralis TaxID=39960 RepID=A0A074MC25_9SPHN|nr:hypothetical protein EH32_01350 [Erythrobacter litoralis]